MVKGEKTRPGRREPEKPVKKSGQDEKQVITVRVQPKARQQALTRLSDSEFRARLISAPVKGQANAELLALLANYFGLAPSCLRIIRGETSRTKLIEIKKMVKSEKTG
jgi:uncharacterized protein (TIGR00251 family)